MQLAHTHPTMSCSYLVYLELSTEYAENGSILDYIHKKHKQPSLTQSLQWAKEVAAGQDCNYYYPSC